jgi:hypothetical protein
MQSQRHAITKIPAGEPTAASRPVKILVANDHAIIRKMLTANARPEWQMDLPMATAGEVCGKPGKLRDDCIRTVCDEHASL